MEVIVMDITTIKNHCLSKKGAFEDFPFGTDVLVIKVANKMFALISHQESKSMISLKCDPFIAQSLREQYSAITPGYHLNKQHWNTVILDESVPDNELYWMIDHSYGLVVKSLTKALQEGLG
jgi:predicted DNA-binding protein (MmcQ/YjbR family)